MSTAAATAAAKLKELKPVQLLRKARDLLAQQDKYRSSIAQLKADLKSSNARVNRLEKQIKLNRSEHEKSLNEALTGYNNRVAAINSLHKEHLCKKDSELKLLSIQALTDKRAGNRVRLYLFTIISLIPRYISNNVP